MWLTQDLSGGMLDNATGCFLHIGLIADLDTLTVIYMSDPALISIN